MKYSVIKTYDNNTGLSCCFRQWRANTTRCSKLHGYAVGVELTFSSETLNDTNWVYGFGSLKWVKKLLEDTFDHKTVIAEDDPELEWFKQGQLQGVLDLVILPNVGCEKFAEFIYNNISSKINDETNGRVKVESVKVFEHGANAAKFSV